MKTRTPYLPLITSAFPVRCCNALVAIAALLATLPAQAATRYWDGGSVDIAATGNGGSAGGAGTWDNTIKNWDQGNALAHVAWTSADSPSFGGTAATVTLGANVTVVGTININSGTAASPYTIAPGAGPYTLTLPAAANLGGSGYGIFSAAISGGTTSLTKAGASTYVLSGTTAFGAGTTALSGGVLRISPASLGTGNLNLSGGGVLGLDANMDLASNTRTVGTGASQVRWTGNGGFAAYGGTRNVRFSSSSVNWTATSFIGTGNTLVLGAADADGTLNWQQAISFAGGARTVQVEDGSVAVDAIMSGIIAGGTSGTGNSLTKTGAGTLALTAANTYWGPTTVSNGTLQVGNGGTVGTLSANSATITVVANATLAVNRSDNVSQSVGGGLGNGAAVISGDGGFAQAGGGITTLSLANTYGGDTTISAGALKLGAANAIPAGVGKGNVTIASGATLDTDTFSASINGLSGAGTVDKTGAGSATLTVGDNDQSSTFNGTIQNTAGTLSLAKTGTGTLSLGGANSFAGTVSVNSGTLALGHLNAVANASGFTLAGGAKLRADVSGLVLSPAVSLTGNATISLNAVGPGSTALSLGAVDGSGNLTLRNESGTSNPQATITLNGASSYSGDTLLTSTDVNSSVFIQLGIANALPATTVLTLDGGDGTGSGRVAELDLNGFNQTVAGLTNVTRSLRTQRVKNTSGTAATLTVNNSSDYSYSGQLGGGGANFGLTKSGSGTFTLSGVNAYSGNTMINGGTLALSGSGSIANSPIISVAGGAVLDVSGVSFTLGASQMLTGYGTVNGAMTVAGTVAPGASIGTLTLNASPTLSGTVSMEIDKAGSPNADKLVVSGAALAYNGTLTVANTGAALTGGEVFDLFDASSFSGAFSTVNLPALGAGLNWWTGNLTSAGTITVNRAPVAQALSTSVGRGDSVGITVIGGKKSPTDADGDTLTVSAVSTPTPNGGSVTNDGTSITYTAPASYSGADSFTYTVSDGKGGTDTKTVAVTVLPAGSGANIVNLSVVGSTATISALGIPGQNYKLQHTDSISPVSWTDTGDTDVASGTGAITLIDSSAPMSGRYYRTQAVP